MPATATRKPAAEAALAALGADPDRHTVADDDRIVLGLCAVGYTGEPFMGVDSLYASFDEAMRAMASRVRDEQDPNEPASFYIDLAERRPTVKVISYDPVYGANSIETHLPLAGLTAAALFETQSEYLVS